MANKEHLAILRKGVDEWNAWRGENREVQLDLSHEDLRGADLSGADLREADLRSTTLSGVNLSRTNLSGANFSRVNLSGICLNGAYLCETNLSGASLSKADLIGANIKGANLRWADLSGATLLGADLSNVNLSGANLNEANLNSCIIDNTIFSDVDLSNVNGLETCQHLSPSTIGIDTIYKSEGKIPEKFLRDAGVPEIFIQYLPSLVDISPIQYYSCFISYCGEDTKFAERLFADLQVKGLRVWFFPESARIGNMVWGEIDEAIRVYDKLIMICTKNSLESDAVIREIERAMLDVPGYNVSQLDDLDRIL